MELANDGCVNRERSKHYHVKIQKKEANTTMLKNKLASDSSIRHLR